MPAFAINQRAFLLLTPQGNILWDCIALLDPATEALVRGLGGLSAIAISHPHYYTTMQDWAAAFDAPVHLHAADRDWVMRAAPSIRFWEGETLEIAPAVTLIRAGGHFAGGTVLHWAGTSDSAGALLAGDIVQVTPGARCVSFMWSYPNMLPLPACRGPARGGAAWLPGPTTASTARSPVRRWRMTAPRSSPAQPRAMWHSWKTVAPAALRDSGARPGLLPGWACDHGGRPVPAHFISISTNTNSLSLSLMTSCSTPAARV